MKLKFLGGAREIGRSAVLVNDSILLDYGMKSGNPPEFPINSINPDSIIASHGHLDHVGSIPTLLSGEYNPTIHWTPPTYNLALLLARDSLKIHKKRNYFPFTNIEIDKMTKNSNTHEYGKKFESAGHEITFFNAGHIPGSAHILVNDGNKKLLYTGDFHTRNQRIVSKTVSRPDADIVISESTYSDVDHRNRNELEKEFAESVKKSVSRGGTVIVPAFAIGRTQEMMLICENFDIEYYVDGMGKEVTDILKEYPKYLRDYKSFKKAKSNAEFVDSRSRKHLTDENTVIITTSGMLSGGPAMKYIPEIRENPVNKITLTGYQVEGSRGRNLIERGNVEIDGKRIYVNSKIEYYDFSAHTDREGLMKFLKEYEDSKIIINHGQRCLKFAEELKKKGFNAMSPKIGKEIEI